MRTPPTRLLSRPSQTATYSRPYAIARVVTTEASTNTAVYTTEPTRAPTNRAQASLPEFGASTPAMSSGTAANSTVRPAATRNFVMITSARRTGVASRWTTLPSSISAPSTPVPMISAVNGSSTEKPKSPSTVAGHGAPTGWEARSTSVSTMRMTAGIGEQERAPAAERGADRDARDCRVEHCSPAS